MENEKYIFYIYFENILFNNGFYGDVSILPAQLSVSDKGGVWKSIEYKLVCVLNSDHQKKSKNLPFGIVSNDYIESSFKMWKLDCSIKCSQQTLTLPSIMFSIDRENDEFRGSIDIHSSSQLFGQLKYQVICISPYVSSHERVIEPKLDKSREFYLIGHRGFGVTPEVFDESRSKDVPYPENTVISFKHALRRGIKMVETDAHYTSDNHIILHHDFNLPNGGPAFLDLTLDQVNACAVGSGSRKENSLYPTLQEVFNAVDENLGFNIELKYPVASENDVHEVQYNLSKNFFIDRLLQTIDRLGGKRVVFLSSFNPDICLMLKLKQKRYPVCQITRGGLVESNNHIDERITHLPNTFNWTKNAGLDGIVSKSACWMQHPNIADDCRELGILTFAYDSTTHTAQFQQFARKHEIRGLIVDSIDAFNL